MATPVTVLHTSRFETSMTVDGQPMLSVSGAIDLGNELLEVSASSAEPILGPSFEPSPVDMVFDFGNDVMYVTNEGQDLGTDVPWVAYDMALVAAKSGTTADELQDTLIGSITPKAYDSSELFTDFNNVQHLGSEMIDGDQFEHFRVAEGISGAIEASPELRGETSEAVLEMLDDSVLDVWLNDDEQLRRMTTTSEVDGAILVAEMNVTDIGVPIVIELPVPNEVIAFEDI